MGVSIQEDLYFLTKAFTLLHDPPYKMWDLPGHEERARELFRRIFNVGITRKMEEIAAKADLFAAALDRFIFLAGSGRNYHVKYWKLHNIFDPAQYEDLPQDVDEVRVREYEEELVKHLSPCRNGRYRECYHALYTLYELQWISKGLPPSLADTRAPTHDVFDHVYAAAMLTNWLLSGEKPTGYLVLVDIPGVQGFVSAARKAGDFWAGSWALSTVVWLTVWPLAWELGPDVLLRPTARFNPIYHAFIEEKIGVRGAILEFYKTLGMGIEHSSAVTLPLIGEKAVLVLPPFRLKEGRAKRWTREEVVKDVTDYFKEALRCLTSIARGEEGNVENEGCRLLSQILGLGAVDELVRELGKLAEFSLPLTVVVVDVAEEYDRLNCPEKLRRLLGDGHCKKVLLFDWLLRSRKDPNSPYLKQIRRRVPTARPYFSPGGFNELKPEAPLNVKSVLNVNVDNSSIDFNPLWRYCSICGNEPAVFGMRKIAGAGGEEDYHPEDWKRVAEAIKGLRKEDLRKIFRPGEFLGPKCLAKRLLYLRVQRAAKLGSTGGVVKFESTEDVAHALLSTRAELFERDKCAKVRQYLNTAGKDLEIFWTGRNSVERMKKDWEECLRSLGDKVVELLKGDLEMFYTTRGLKNVAIALAGPRLFYAVVRGDGDSVGKLHDGCLPGDWYQMAREIIKTMKAEGDVQQFESDRKKALEILSAIEEYLGEIAKRDGTCEKPPVLITPTYKVAISRALAVSSLRDWNTVEKYRGTLIYAGGDDVVALAPVETAILMAGELRSNYWGEKGFHKLGKERPPATSRRPYQMPAVAAYGRSFTVRYIHIMDLMSEELLKSHEDLEKAKGAKWLGFEKDSIAITSSRSKAEAVLPFREPGEVVRILHRTWTAMLAGEISRNTPRDLDVALGEGAERAELMRHIEALGKVVAYVIARNAVYHKTAEEISALIGEGTRKYGYAFIEGMNNSMKILRRLP